jgi:hypothetical protein
MKKLLLLNLIVALNFVAFSQEIEKVDPDHVKAGGYGYIIGSDKACTVWWAEGTYKVMRDTPVPEKKDSEIKMWSAKNEYTIMRTNYEQ